MEKPHRKLAVWSKSVELSVLTYKITEFWGQAPFNEPQ